MILIYRHEVQLFLVTKDNDPSAPPTFFYIMTDRSARAKNAVVCGGDPIV